MLLRIIKFAKQREDNSGGGGVVMSGMIKTVRGAGNRQFPGTESFTLDKTARAVAEPELEIETNNVKASHAASVGQVDKEQILYLMSRGLTKELAQDEIISGFLGVKWWNV
jgi:Fe-S cluster assembly scaffold protein SufB